MENSLLFNEDTEFSVLLPYLADKKPGSAAIDRLFAKQIIRNHHPAESYFLGDYSRPMLNKLAVNLFDIPEEYAFGEPADIVLGEFYELMAKPFEGKKKEWKNLQSYKGVNKKGVETRLHSYVYTVTRNHFLSIMKKKKKDFGIEFSDIITEDSMHSGWDIDTWDKNDYEIILNCEIEGIKEGKDIERNIYLDDNEDNDQLLIKRKMAFEAYWYLPEMDRIILQCLVIEKMHWTDAYGELRKFMNPDGPKNEWKNWTFEEKQKAMDEFWTPKDKQDAIRGIKKRAIRHLTAIYNKIRKEKQYGKAKNPI